MAKADKTKRILIFCLIITVMTFLKVMLWNFGDLDELWNYNLSRGIVMGMVPYRDFNMVLTPLFAFVNSFALLLSRSLIAYRISCSLILTVLMLLVFKAVYDRTNEYYAMPSALICLMFSGVVTYNTLFMIFALSVYMLLARENKSSGNFLIGISAACAALSRQTSGGVLIILVFIILLSPLSGASGAKQRAGNILMYLAGGAVPCVLFLIYLLATGSFSSFWEYCFFGLFAFGSGNGLFEISAVPYLLVALAGIACDVVLMKTDFKASLLHLLTGVTVLLISVPIVESMHTAYSAIWFSIPVVLFIRKRFGGQLSRKISVLLSAILAVAVSAMTVAGTAGCAVVKGSSELKGIAADTALITDYATLAMKNKEYEEMGYRVTTLSNSAVLVSVAEGDIDPVFDMFNKGNFGRKEPMEYVEEVLSRQDALILMPDDYPAEGWQNPEGIYEYVTSHCEVIGSYGRFKWYKPV